MAPSRLSSSSHSNMTTANSLSLLSEYTHTLDSLPLDLSRNFADLRELDAVLSSSMSSITAKIHNLTRMIEQGAAPKEERLWLLTEIAEEATRLKLGGEDKIRVACQAADNLKSHTSHLRTLSEHLPGFDPTTLNRKTIYPHVAARSFMPPASLDTGRRRRGALLVSAPDPSPAKRKRVVRDDDFDMSHMRSPKKDKPIDGNSRQRNGARVKKNERAVSPSESLVSVTSHIPAQPQPISTSNSRGGSNQMSRLGNNSGSAANKRARSSATNNRGPSPLPIEHYSHSPSYEHPPTNNAQNNGISSRREAFNVPPSSSHPSLPLPYQTTNGPPNSAIIGHHGHSSNPVYDLHTLPHAMSNTPDWNPPQQLEGPGMPVARSTSIHPVLANIPVSTSGGTDGGATEGGDGEGDGDDRTYCFCDAISYGEMIACDDAQCEREWFHLACIGLTVPPEGRWFCETCRTKRNAKRTGRGGKRRAVGTRAGGRAS